MMLAACIDVIRLTAIGENLLILEASDHLHNSPTELQLNNYVSLNEYNLNTVLVYYTSMVQEY